MTGSEGVARPLRIMPLRVIARDAKRLGFVLHWRENASVFEVKLEPTSDKALEACRGVTQQGVAVAIQSSTTYPPNATVGDRLELMQQTGREALAVARQLLG